MCTNIVSTQSQCGVEWNFWYYFMLCRLSQGVNPSLRVIYLSSTFKYLQLASWCCYRYRKNSFNIMKTCITTFLGRHSQQIFDSTQNILWVIDNTYKTFIRYDRCQLFLLLNQQYFCLSLSVLWKFSLHYHACKCIMQSIILYDK